MKIDYIPNPFDQKFTDVFLDENYIGFIKKESENKYRWYFHNTQLLGGFEHNLQAAKNILSQMIMRHYQKPINYNCEILPKNYPLPEMKII